MSSPRWDVVCAGDVFVDLILTGFPRLPQLGEEGFAQSLTRAPGGGAVITAAGLARWGYKTALAACLGHDGEWLAAELDRYEVALAVECRPSRPTGLTVSVSAAGDRILYTHQGANEELPAQLPRIAALAQSRGARWLHLACCPADDLAWLRSLRSAGCLVSLDVGWHPAWLESKAAWRALREVDLFLPNLQEATLMAGTTETEQILEVFAAQGVRRLALKRGGRGASLLWEGAVWHAPAPTVDVVDTTGAGDCFNAGLIAGLLDGLPPHECLALAVACGASSTQAAGGLAGWPERNEIARRDSPVSRHTH